MEILNLILSSVVIVAVINMIIQNRTNKLQYITSERSKWREEIKKSALELGKCSSYGKKCKKLFVKLKVNLNSYGYCADGNYPEDKKLNIMQDQHIWKEMDYIEKGKVQFSQGKKHLQEYLSLLLKFDWERSKEEAETDAGLVVSIILYWLMVAMGIFFHKDIFQDGKFSLDLEAAMSSVIAYLIPFMCIWSIRFMDSIKNIRDDKWYKMTFWWLIFWIIGILLFGVVHLYFYFMNAMAFVWLGGVILFFIAFFLMADSTVEKKRRYARYENAVICIMPEVPFMLHLYSEGVLELLVADKFEKLNIKIDWGYSDHNQELVKDLIDELKTLEHADIRWKKYVRWRHRVKYMVIRLWEKNILLEDYILEHPKCLKAILKYENKYYVGYPKMLMIKTD